MMKTILLRSVLAALMAGLGFYCNVASAFVTFGNGFGSKWDDPTFGTGATVTWSFMTPGVGLASIPAQSFPPADLSGTNTLGTGVSDDIRKKIDDVNGAGAFDAAVSRAFATWAAAANLTFIQVADPAGNLPMAGSTTPDIRIGAFHIDSPFTGGIGFGPPGDDVNFPDALAGDFALNDTNRFQIAPGNEGDALPTDINGFYLNDIEGLFLHEIGHTLGLYHSNVIDGVMCGFPTNTCDFTRINRALDADDIMGIQTIYGTPVPLPATVWLMLSAFVGLLGVNRHRV